MNGLIRLTPQIVSTASPLKPVSGLSESEQLSPGFSDAFVNASSSISANSSANIFAVVDSGVREVDGELEEDDGDNIVDDILPLEPAKSEGEKPEPLKPDLDTPVIATGKSEKPEVFIKPRAGMEGESVSEAMLKSAPESTPASIAESAIARPDKMAQESVVTHGGMQGDTVAQDKLLARSGRISSPLVRDASIKEKPVVFTEKLPSKAAQSLGEVPTKASGLEQKIITGFAPDEAASSRAVRSGPAPLANVTASAATINDTAMAQNASASPTVSPVPLSPLAVSSTPLPHSTISAPIPAPVPPVALTLTMDAGNQWIARLSHDIGQLSSEKPTLNFQLKPEHLGKLSVRISASAAGDVVRMETENENVKALLVGSQGRLEQDIRLSGLKLARVDVTVQDNSGSQLGQQGAGPRDGGAEPGRGGGAQRDGQSLGSQSPRNKPQAATEQNMLLQNSIADASLHHGARYA